MMAGSSWPEDEAIYSGWINSHPDIKLVIAPHEFNNHRLASLKKLFRNEAVLMSETDKNPGLIKNARVMIIDCFGLLSSAYAYCDIAYVGGAFGSGLHNINEPAVYDIPVIFGPNNNKFIEAQEMANAGGAFPIHGKDDFKRIADALFYNNSLRKEKGINAGNYIRSKTGATEKIFKKIFYQ